MSTPLAHYGALLLPQWRWVVWGILLALVATTVLLILSPPLYRAEATVFVRTPGDVSRVQDGGDSYAQGRAGTYAALVKSTSVSSRVVADLGQDLRPEVLSQRIQATHPRGTALIDIAVSAPSAAEAQRTATLLLSEYAATVRTLESVPGSLVPRAELVVVDPPGRPVRLLAWGAPIPVVLLGATLIGLVLGSFGAVLRSIIKSPVHDHNRSATIGGSPDSDVITTPIVRGGPDANIETTPTGRATGRHRRLWRKLTGTNEGDKWT
jgi:capsular polysaccharide biosynthesis protein